MLSKVTWATALKHLTHRYIIKESYVKGENIKWYIMGVLIGFLVIGMGIYGVRNRKGNSLAYFVISVGQIVLGIWTIIIIIFVFLARELKIDLLELLPK